MAINKYPYTDFHEMNLDWVIRKIKELQNEMNEFEIINQIKPMGVWDITKAYPKYALVSYNGFGFISLKEVPIGIPIANPDYWLTAFEYDPLLHWLDTRIDNMEYTDLLHGSIVCIGDSYLVGWSYDGDVTPWGTILKEDLLQKSDMYNFAYGGTGFCNTVDDKNFTTLVEDAAADVAVHNDEVSLVLFGGGWNDKGYTVAQLESGIQDAIDAVNSNFPNARIMFAFMAWGTNANYHVYNRLYLPDRYSQALRGKDIIFFENCYKCLQLKSGLMDSDGSHPVEAGQKEIANAIYDFLLGGYSNSTIESRQASDNSQIYFSADENTAAIMFYYDFQRTVNEASFTCNGQNKLYEIDLNALGFGIKPGSDYLHFQMNGWLENEDPTSKFWEVTFIMKLTAAGKLELYPEAINEAGTNYLTLNNVKTLTIMSGSIIVPRIYL